MFSAKSQLGGLGAATAQNSTSIFKISASQLKDLFNREVDAANRLSLLTTTHRGAEGILTKLQSKPDSGIMGDPADLRRRQLKYAKNEKPRVQRPPFLESLKDGLNDRILLLVAIFAILSIIPGMIVEPKSGWVEGVFILVALFIQVLITALNDYSKDTKFVDLQSLNREESLPVLRGKNGSMQTVSVWGMVVGDVIQLQPGDKIPADCLVLESNNLSVKEIIRHDNGDETDTFTSTNLYKNATDAPFLYCDSFVLAGTCKALVCCVGENSSRGINDTQYDTADRETELTRKLDAIGGTLKFFGLISSFVVLGVSLLVLFLQVGVNDEVKGDDFIKKLTENIVISLIILVVAIPEGLPMAVAASVAQSVLQMSKHDNVLVRDITSVETVGLITDLCLGKTGTMTTEEMQVVNFYTQDLFVKNTRINTFNNCDLDEIIHTKIIESIVYNSQAYIEMTENSFYLPVGNGTEVSLLKWLQKAEIPIHEVMATKSGNVVAQVPFNSKLKRSIVAVKHPQLQDVVRIYVKGAPEIVVRACKNTYDKEDAVTEEGEKYQRALKVPMSDEAKDKIFEHMNKDMTKNALRAIAFSYTDMSTSDFEGVMRAMQGEIDSEDEIQKLEQDQTFLALVGLKDPSREKIKEIIDIANDSGINVRMCSGDNLNTSVAVAYDCGILNRNEYNAPADEFNNIAMDAIRFREIVGDVIRTQAEVEEGEEAKTLYSLANQQAFNQIIGNLKVIGRAEPEDKLRLVAGLKGLNAAEENEVSEAEHENEDGEQIVRRGTKKAPKKVACVGEGINDIEAFEAADVSFALQSGTSYARNKASMVLQTDNFDSCIQAVRWGRNIQMNVQRFLQFQITCNLACLVTVIVSYCTITDSAFNAVMLIWINLIMDILGALALASTRPTAEIAYFRCGQGNIMTPPMYRQIFGVSLYMIAIMMIIMYAGKSILNFHYTNATQAIEDTIAGHSKMQHFTLIFNTFIFLQFFNLINCRDVSAAKLHGFHGLHRNFMTWLVLLVIFAVQFFACFTWLFRPIFETQPCDPRGFAVTCCMAASVILINMLLKFIPEKWISKLPEMNEENAVGKGSFLTRTFDEQSKKKAYVPQSGAAAVSNVDESFNEDAKSGDDNDGFKNVA